MSFYSFLKRLQRKPEREKRKIIVALAVLCALGVGFLGFESIKREFTGKPSLFSLESEKNQEGNEENKSADTNEAGPIESLTKGLALIFSDLKEKSQEFLSQTSEIVSEETTTSERAVYKLPSH